MKYTKSYLEIIDAVKLVDNTYFYIIKYVKIKNRYYAIAVDKDLYREDLDDYEQDFEVLVINNYKNDNETFVYLEDMKEFEMVLDRLEKVWDKEMNREE
jgi:hypothetical protein